MRSGYEETDRIVSALKMAWQEKEQQSASPQWERKVMYSIRSLDPIKPQVLVWNDPLIWRAVAAVSLSALIMLGYSLTNNLSLEYEAARLMLDDPTGVKYAQLFLP